MELKRTNQELEKCRSELQICLESNRKLMREIADLQNELSVIKITKEEHATVFGNVSSALNQYDSHSPAKMENCSDEGLLRTEELLNLLMELDILKIVLAEERTARVEVEERSASLRDKLQEAEIRILQACEQSEAMEREITLIEGLESHQIMLTNELAELKKNNQQSSELLNLRAMEVSRLNNELDIYRRKELLVIEDSKVQLLKCSSNEDSPLQRKLKRMQASLEKARDLNTRYQRDQASHNSAEQEMEEVRRQVELETAEVIMCLQEEQLLLQQQLEASNKSELSAKQSLDELQLEGKRLNDKLVEVLKENESLSSVIKTKEKEIELLTNDWDRLAAEIGRYLVDGNAALDEASDRVASISFSQRKWVEDQVQKMCRGISERDKLLEDLQNRLKEADGIRCDMELKLKSLRGAMQAINEVHQQEKGDQEREICLLRSQVTEQGSVNNQQAEQIHKIELLLDESLDTLIQKVVLEQSYVSLQRGMKEEIRQLETQLDQSKSYLAQLLSQTQDKDHAIEKLKNEECAVLLRLMSDVLKAKGVIQDLGVGFNELQSINVSPEETVCQNSDLASEDRDDPETFEDFQPSEQINSEVRCRLNKEMDCVVQQLQMMQSQMATFLQEKENVKEFYCESQRSMKDLTDEVLKLNSDIFDKERCYKSRLNELEMKVQEKDDAFAASVISWNNEKEALENELSKAKILAAQKSSEALTLLVKFEEAQATISDADSTVKALVEANENAKLEAEKYKVKEALFITEKDDMLSEINSLKVQLDMKEKRLRAYSKEIPVKHV